MNRRNAITNIVILSVGAVVLPSCAQNEEAAAIKLKTISLTGSQEKLLLQLSNAILPFKQAKETEDIKPYEFTMLMVDDCYEPENQQKFMAGLKGFDKLAKSKYGNSFATMPPAQKSDFLATIEKKKDLPEEVVYFYETMKRHTVQAFTSSNYYMTNVLKYKMVPGSNFKGCVPVTKAS